MAAPSVPTVPDTRAGLPYAGIVWLGRNSDIGYIDVTPWAHKGDRARVKDAQGRLAERIAELLNDDNAAQALLVELRTALGET